MDDMTRCSKSSCGGDEVQQIVDQLEGDADVAAVAVGGLDLRFARLGEDGRRLAAVRHQTRRLVE